MYIIFSQHWSWQVVILFHNQHYQEMAFILYTCFIVLAANPLISYCNLVTYGTHFKVLYGDKLDNETSDESTPFISQHFHECGMGKACNYVVKQTNTKLYSKVNEEKNLPGNDEIAWKKIASEGRNVSKLSKQIILKICSCPVPKQ